MLLSWLLRGVVLSLSSLGSLALNPHTLQHIQKQRLLSQAQALEHFLTQVRTRSFICREIWEVHWIPNALGEIRVQAFCTSDKQKRLTLLLTHLEWQAQFTHAKLIFNGQRLSATAGHFCLKKDGHQSYLVISTKARIRRTDHISSE